jgi:uncharacterized membrane-anchored protein
VKQLLFSIALLAQTCLVFAKETPKTAEDSARMILANIESSFKYQTGEVTVGDNLAKIKIPSGFRFLDAKQAEMVVYELWGNPKGEGSTQQLYGMIVPEKISITDEKSWAFVIQYDGMGFVKDDDADKINYVDLLKELQSGEKEENAERAKLGFPAMNLVGWAKQPFYDKSRKTLHWAKEISVVGSDENTLNYNVRILGRKGVLVLNAVGNMSSLPDISPNIEAVLSSVTFTEGNKYSDFNPSVDNVAAWTIGGLVAGKVLAKVGLFAFFAKFAKVIFIAIAAGGSAVWRWIKGRKKDEDEVIEQENEVA